MSFGFKFLLSTFKSPLGLTVGKLAKVEVVGCNFEEPLGVDDSAGAYVVLACEHELVVADELGFVVDHGRRVHQNYLVIL